MQEVLTRCLYCYAADTICTHACQPYTLTWDAMQSADTAGTAACPYKEGRMHYYPLKRD